MIALDAVAKSRGGRQVLASVSLRLAGGRVLCLTGPSGSGKSTILDIIAGILRPDHGRRRIGGGRLGYAPQEHVFLPWKTVRENLVFALSGSGLPDIKALADNWLDRLGLADLMHHRPGELSGGQRRRLNLARSLAVEPELLLWDEPFVFLDTSWQEEATRVLNEVIGTSAPTVVVVTHQWQSSLLPGWPVLEIDSRPVELEWNEN